ncbi:U3 small nucleolar RNA-associated protein 25 [Sergentomyia squamirostris]
MVKNKSMKGRGKGKKNYKHSRKNLRFREISKAKEKKKLGENYKFIKKMKNIQRNTENEEILRKQQQIESRRQHKRQNFSAIIPEGSEEEDQEDGDYYSKVLNMLNVSNKASKAIETSSEEEDSEEEAEEEKTENPESSENDEEPSESESEAEEEEDSTQNDPYLNHLDYDLSPEMYDRISRNEEMQEICDQKILSWPKLGRLLINIPKSSKSEGQPSGKKKKKLLLLEDEEKFAEEGSVPERVSARKVKLEDLHVKSQLYGNAEELSKEIHSEPRVFSDFQAELFSILNNYQDLYMPRRTFENSEEIRFTYCLHALNHVLKSYTKVTHHNSKLGKESGKGLKSDDKNLRDQGLVRPKILIILPFKNSAYLVINMLIKLLAPELAGKVINHKRYVEEFTGEQLDFPKRNPKPDDYEKIFAGNTDDNFRIGISVTKKCLKLYSEFYSADFIVASPLGLRMIIGADGDEKRDYDFLSSIEMLVIDQMDVIMAQNWLHLLHIFEHLHLKLQTRKNTDFSRVRSWCLNGWSRFYRQTLLFSSHDLPEFDSVLIKNCQNYRGSVRLANPTVVGSIQQVRLQINQVFHRIEVKSLEVAHDTRFEYFITSILPRFKSPFMAHCLIYVPDYFNFVRIRNYFKKESINFVHVCEYTEDAKIARARDMFFHSDSAAHFLLYTERAHFYRRTRIKGIRHVIMYQPPAWPEFYPEIINLMQEPYQNPRDGLDSHSSVTVLYTKYDALRTAAILGTEEATSMIKSGKSTHTIMKDK